jgi:DeoR/GlpR family transcriptional regulator of sugar metabolism
VPRHLDVAETVRTHGFQSVNALAAAFGVDISTIRRDLERLEQMGLVERTHGGAIPVAHAETPTQVRASLHREEKAAIGRAMADRVLDGQTIMLSAGTTTLEVARHLTQERVTVVTNDLRIGMEVADRQKLHLVFIGGDLLPNDYRMWGPTAVQQLSNLRVDVAIFGADTVSTEGIFSVSSYGIELNRIMMSIAREAFFVADSSKFGREALFKVFGFDEFTAGITDDLLDPLRASRFPLPVIQVAPESRRAEHHS